MNLSQDLQTLFQNENKITFRDFLEQTQSKSYSFLLILLALPAALPVPAPGYATPFGLVLVLLGLQILTARQTPWFPEWALKKELPVTKGSKLLGAMIKFLKFFEIFLRPRLRFLTRGAGYRLLGLLVALCGASMIIPLPLTNTVPSFGIFIIGLALLEEDGLAALAGAVSALTGLVLSGTLIYFYVRLGEAGITLVENWLSNLF